MQPIIENELAKMDMDISIEDIPDYVTLRSEQFEQLSNLASRGINIPVEMIIESSSIHNKSKLLSIVKAQSDAQAQQAQMQLQLAQADLAFKQEQAQRDYELKLKELELELAKINSQTMVNTSRAVLNTAQAEQVISETTETDINVAKSNIF